MNHNILKHNSAKIQKYTIHILLQVFIYQNVFIRSVSWTGENLSVRNIFVAHRHDDEGNQ